MRLKMLVRSVGLILTMGLAACAKMEFTPVDLTETKLSDDSEDLNPPVVIMDPNMVQLQSVTMKLGVSQASFVQENLDSNRTVVNFQVVNQNGEFVNNLTQNSIALSENGIPVRGFTMTSNPQESRRTVDIAFLIDVTCSMNPTIASAKARVVNFIRSSREAGYHTRMCLSTFGDYTVRRCDRFFDNDPSKPETSAQVDELINEVNRLTAGCGINDPGGSDLAENPLQAILDVEQAPWAEGSQRFGILITDAGFLHNSGNPGALGANAPSYNNVISSLRRSQVNLFAATPSMPGYNLNFGRELGLIAASNGEHFPYANLVNGSTNLNTILNRILLRVQTTYALEYVADETPGLDAALPLNQRTFVVTLVDGTTETVRVVGSTSSLPAGRAEYKKKFKLSDKEIDQQSLVLKVDGQVVSSGYRISNGEVVFDQAPRRGTRIDVEYNYLSLSDSLQTVPLVLPENEDLNRIAVFFNNIKVTGVYVRFEKNLEERWMLLLNTAALSEKDPFNIRKNGQLEVKVYRAQ